jgi:glutamate-ammonia-ligase adenylyltransferase
MTQRLVNLLSSLNPAGALYDIDTRLRPSGKQGLLAVSTKALKHYFEELAWTFEYMAFSKARAVAGDAGLCVGLNEFIHELITDSRDPAKLKHDVADMRKKVETERHTTDPWSIKHVRGGLIDIDFLAQYWLLLYAPAHPDAPRGNAQLVFSWLSAHGLEDKAMLDTLLSANRFMNEIFNLLRLTVGNKFDEQAALPALKAILCEAVRAPSFDALKNTLASLQERVFDIYRKTMQ